MSNFRRDMAVGVAGSVLLAALGIAAWPLGLVVAGVAHAAVNGRKTARRSEEDEGSASFDGIDESQEHLDATSRPHSEDPSLKNDAYFRRHGG